MARKWRTLGAVMVAVAALILITSPILYEIAMRWYKSFGIDTEDAMSMAGLPVLMAIVFSVLPLAAGGVFLVVEGKPNA